MCIYTIKMQKINLKYSRGWCSTPPVMLKLVVSKNSDYSVLFHLILVS